VHPIRFSNGSFHASPQTWDLLRHGLIRKTEKMGRPARFPCHRCYNRKVLAGHLFLYGNRVLNRPEQPFLRFLLTPRAKDRPRCSGAARPKGGGLQTGQVKSPDAASCSVASMVNSAISFVPAVVTTRSSLPLSAAPVSSRPLRLRSTSCASHKKTRSIRRRDTGWRET
jgi:hypothetical protein